MADLATGLPEPSGALPEQEASPQPIPPPQPVSPTPASSPRSVSEPTPPPAPSYNMMDRVAQARSQGATWDQIAQGLAPRFEEARKAGATPEQINKALGYGSDLPVLSALQNYFDNLPGNGAADPGDIKKFYADAIADSRANDPQRFGATVARAVRGVVEGAVAGAKQGWGEGSVYEPAQPGETRLQALGRILSIDLGAASRTMSAGFGAVQGAVEGGFSGAGAPRLGRDLAAIPEAFMGSPEGLGVHPAEGAAGKAIGDRLPAMPEITDGAVATQMNTVGKVTPGQTNLVVGNIARNWATSGDTPAEAAVRAATDGWFRDNVMSPQPPEPPFGSSETLTEGGTFVVPKNPPEPTGPANQGRVVRGQGSATDIAMNEMGMRSHDPTTKAFIERGGGDLDPNSNNWCAAFVNSALEQSGRAGSGSNVATSFLRWGDRVDPSSVEKNDVVVIPRGHAAGETGGHVGLATGDTRMGKDGLEVEIISGNDSGQVKMSWRPADQVQVRRSDKSSTAQTHGDILDRIAANEGAKDDFVSSAGAVGKFQITPDTARTLGLDPNRLTEPTYNRMAAEKNLEYIKKQGFTRDEDILVAWDAGPGAARKWVDGGRRIEDLPPETQQYLTRARENGRYIPHKVETAAAEEPIERNPAELELGGGSALNPPKAEDIYDAMRSRIGTEKSNYWGDTKQWVKDAYLDLFEPTKSIIGHVEDAVNKGSTLTDLNNPLYAYRLAEHADSTAQYVINRKMVDINGKEVGPGFLEILNRFKSTKEKRNFEGYAIARWAIEKAIQNKETGADVLTAAHLDKAEHAKFGSAFDELMKFQNQSLAMLRDSGFIDKEGYDNIVRENTARIPGYRVDETGKRTTGTSSRGTSNPVKKFFGSKEKIQSPFKSIMQDAFVRAHLARMNEANKALVDLLSPHGIAEKAASSSLKFELNPAELRKLGAAEETGEIWRRLGHQIRDDEIPVWRDGKMESWRVLEDPTTGKVDMAATRYIRGMSPAQQTVLGQLMRPFAKFQRAMTVANPLFPVRLMIYDIPWQFITKPGFRNTLADYIVGLGNLLGKTAKYEAYLKSGAAERVFAGLAKDQFIKDVMKGLEDPSMARTARNVLGYIPEKSRAWTQMMTQPVKVGRYIRGVQRGESARTAAINASEAAFHRSSFGGPGAKALNAVHPFTAAYLNGLNQTLRAFITGGKTTAGEEIKVWQSWVKAVAIITVPAITNYLMNKDEEWYKAVPQWQKDTGMNFNVGGHVMFVPFPPLTGFIFGGLPKVIVDGYLKGKSAKDIAGSGLAGLATSLAPSMGLFLAGNFVQPIIEHLANHSFFRGRPLTPNDSLLPSAAGSPYSTGLARMISRQLPDALGASPQVVDNYIQGWGGTMGAQVARGLDLLLGTGPRAENPPPLKVEDLPFLGSWTARYPSASAQPIVDFNEQSKRYEHIHSSVLAAMRQGDKSLFNALLNSSSDLEMAVAFDQTRMSKTEAQLFQLHPEMAAQLQRKMQSLQFDKQKAQQIVMAEKAVRQLGELAKQIQAAPETANVPQINEPSATGLPKPIGQTRGLSGTDKGQLLDRIYNWMQRMSERGLESGLPR